MRSLVIVGLLAAASAGLPGCGATLLLRVYTVDARSTGHGKIQTGSDTAGLNPVGGVRFFFYPYVRDSVIHRVPEREFVTDSNGHAEYVETVSPMGDKMGALVAMKAGYAVDTVIFPFGLDDTVSIIFRMHAR